MPAWLDNGFHSHGKRELVKLAVDGLLARAMSRATDLLTDGWVEESWVEKQLIGERPGDRKGILELAVAHRILEPLAAGETRVMVGAPRSKLRAEEIKVTVGPFEIDGYLVHDFLDCNRARVEVHRRRLQDRQRQRKRRNGERQEPLRPAGDFWENEGQIDAVPPLPEDASSSSCHARVTRDVTRDPRDRDRDVNHQGTDQEDLNHARAARSADPRVQNVLDILAAAPRLYVDAIAVENAMLMYPNGNAVMAAHEAVTLGRDPAFRITNAATLVRKALERQPAGGGEPFGRQRSGSPTGADFRALKSGGGVR